MALQIVEANERTYTVAMDEPIPVSRRLWAAVQTRVVDELTGAPPRTTIRLATSSPGFAARVGPDGLVGLLAIPDTVFPHLDAQSYSIPFDVYGDGYIPRHEVATLPPNPLFPAEFVPFVFAADLALHRVPVRITVNVRRRNGGALQPVAGADVEVTGVWTVLVPAAAEPPPDPATIVSLDPPLYAHRSTASGQLRPRAVVPVLGEDKALLEYAHAGDTTLQISDWINLNPGDLLLLDTDPAIQEYATIDAIEPVGAADLPAAVTLTHSLAYAHRTGRRAQRVVPQAPGPARAFDRDAIPGDTCVFLANTAGLAGVDVVEVFGGPAPAEFHRIDLFVGNTDADGRCRLPLLSRVAKLEVSASEGVTSGTVEYIPDYTLRENHLSLELT